MRSSKVQIILLFLFTVFLISGMAYAEAPENLTSYIDEHNCFVLNGKPFFPLGLYVVQCTNGAYAAQLQEIADSPFDTLMNYAVNRCGTDATDADILRYLDQLASRNLKLIFSLSEYFGHGQKDMETIVHKVMTFKDHPAIISWYINDERGPEYLPELVIRYETIKKLDGNNPVWSVHWNTDWLIREARTTDLVGVDPYPIGNHPLTLVSQMADAAKKSGKPLWLVPQIFDWRDYPNDPAGRDRTGRPPTRDEMRAMTYLAINHGAKGLIYYSYFNILDDADYQTRWEEIKEIAREINDLRPVLLSTHQTKENDIVCNNSNIDFKLMREGKTYYLFAVNTKKETFNRVSFRNRLVNKPSMIGVLFENGRHIAVTDGNFTDNFGPYEVHVYHWKESSKLKAQSSKGREVPLE